jgi:hypothetical protein
VSGAALLERALRKNKAGYSSSTVPAFVPYGWLRALLPL